MEFFLIWKDYLKYFLTVPATVIRLVAGTYDYGLHLKIALLYHSCLATVDHSKMASFLPRFAVAVEKSLYSSRVITFWTIFMFKNALY